MGLNVYHVPTSLICRGETWWTFVRMWVENAEAWTQVYNRHLAAYRRRQGIKNDHHPMPDLERGAAYELPFWIYGRGEERQRLSVRKTGGKVTVLHGEEEITLPERFEEFPKELFIRPRALSLTMYMRMYLADLFIHGIGGALYDQITDGILAELFGMTPPYACVSAAWLLPLGQPLEGLDDISELRSRRHHVLHNPQRAIDPFTAVKTDVAELIMERRTLLEQMERSLRDARKNPAAREQRQEWFRKLHGVNVALHLKAPRVLERFDREIAESERALEQNKVLLWREYFLGLHSMESLGKLVERVRGSA
jgi:hypothetical protein